MNLMRAIDFKYSAQSGIIYLFFFLHLHTTGEMLRNKEFEFPAEDLTVS